MAGEPKILYIDIETAPNTVYTWDLYEQNAIRVVRDWYVLMVGFRWAHKGKTQCYTLPDFKLYKKDHKNDRDLINAVWDLFNEADVIVAHNGDRFDIRKLNARFLVHGLTPPSPYKTADTKKIAKAVAGFSSNKLDDLARQLGLKRKKDPGNFDTWEGCMAFPLHRPSWKHMKEYCMQDVDVLYDVHQVLKSWARTFPNLGNIVGEDGLCPRCASDKLQKRGIGPVGGGVAQRYQCMKCFGWSHGPVHRINTIR